MPVWVRRGVAAQMKRSTVVGNGGNGVVDNIRTSYGMFIRRLHDPIIERIERRISLWTHLPMENQEDIQVRMGLHVWVPARVCVCGWVGVHVWVPTLRMRGVSREQRGGVMAGCCAQRHAWAAAGECFAYSSAAAFVRAHLPSVA